MTRYLEFFSLQEDPFRLTPDPFYYYPSQEHITALRSLDYCLEQQEGFCLLTGHPGTGKTTLLKMIMTDWRERAEIALVMTPRLSPEEFLRAILEDFAIPCGELGKNEMLKVFRDFLLKNSEAGKRVVIIVDEAQNVTTETLEELRLLSNLETDKEKLLQIILAGQPELRQRLQGEELLQLYQRIAIRIVLPPLSATETSDYLNTRLVKAGSGASIFAKSAREIIHRLSGGVPRVINLLASRSIMAAYLSGTGTISKKHVLVGARDLEECPLPVNRWWREKLVYCLLFLIIAGAAAAMTTVLLDTKKPAQLPVNPVRQVPAPPHVIPQEVKKIAPPPLRLVPPLPGNHHAGVIVSERAPLRTKPVLESTSVAETARGEMFTILKQPDGNFGTDWYLVLGTDNKEYWLNNKDAHLLR